MDKNNEPVAKVDSGETVVFETMDCFSDTIETENDTISSIDFDDINPATGPLYVNDAEPGDVLKVTFESIKLADTAVVIASPGLAMLGERIEEEETKIVDVTEEGVEISGHTVPLRKMMGVVGTAAGDKAWNTGTPYDHGGNMDVTEVTEGATLYLPVHTEGALLAMGDAHATMGDGEIGGAGAEVATETTVTVEVLKDSDIPTPMVETEDEYVAIGSREKFEDAAHLAVNNMADFLMSRTGISLNHASMLLSIAGDLHTAQMANPVYTAKMRLNKKYFE
jgi:amidase